MHKPVSLHLHAFPYKSILHSSPEAANVHRICQRNHHLCHLDLFCGSAFTPIIPQSPRAEVNQEARWL